MPSQRRVQVIARPLPARVPDGAVYVGRRAWGLPESPVGNPWKIGRDVPDHAAAVERFRTKLLMEPDFVAMAAEYIGDSDVACWCGLDELCHGDVLLEFVTAYREPHDEDPEAFA